MINLRQRNWRFPWLVFGLGAVVGFLLTVAANVASKLLALFIVSFASGWLIGRFWSRKSYERPRFRPDWRMNWPPN